MSEIIIVGGGIAGMTGALLLARDGHRVTVLERDPDPPSSPATAWSDWQRRGVNQFRLPHYFLARFRQLLDDELADAAAALDAAGALRVNRLAQLPDSMTGGWRPGDDRFEQLTGRRPMVEATLARLAEAEPGVAIRRGVVVGGLQLTERAAGGVPQVSGVLTEGGERLDADLVVDAGGRRSMMSDWLTAIGAPPPAAEVADSGFVYFTRHFRSADGEMPPMIGPPAQAYDSVSTLTLPADNGYWSVVLLARSTDAVMRRVHKVEVWDRVVRSYPLVAHWLDGEPVTGVEVMAGIEDRKRSLLRDGAPVATGVVTVGDAYACTNPSLGRGASLALLHVTCLRDVLRKVGTGEPVELLRSWHEVNAKVIDPLVDDTLAFDRHRRAEIDAQIAGIPYETDDAGWWLGQALRAGAPHDPDLLRGVLDIASLLERGVDVLGRDGIMDKVLAVGEVAPPPGPSRRELLDIVAR